MVVMNYIPLWGWLMAFQNYKPKQGLHIVSEANWVGLLHFKRLFSDDSFLRVIRNTLAMSSLNLVFGTIAAIFTALMINEIGRTGFKRTVQTISYLPHFISWVVAASIIFNVLSADGIINRILLGLGLIDDPVIWLSRPDLFWGIVTVSGIWKEVGFGSIIYLSAITSVDPNLYEAATIDGAGRLQRIRFITIPSIMPTIKLLLILNIGRILSTGFEKQMLLGNSIVYTVSEVLDLFVLKYGISLGRYSFATAAGVFKSFVSVVLIWGSNSIAKKMGDEALF